MGRVAIGRTQVRNTVAAAAKLPSPGAPIKLERIQIQMSLGRAIAARGRVSKFREYYGVQKEREESARSKEKTGGERKETGENGKWRKKPGIRRGSMVRKRWTAKMEGDEARERGTVSLHLPVVYTLCASPCIGNIRRGPPAVYVLCRAFHSLPRSALSLCPARAFSHALSHDL